MRVANRYCSNCGNELREDDAFCGSCGRPVQETAQVPTPEADVPVPPPAGEDQKDAADQPVEQDAGGEESEVVFRVTGDPGLAFSGTITTLDRQRSVEGTTPQDFPVEMDTDAFSGDVLSVDAQKSGTDGNLVVQVLRDDEVVKESSTNADYGIASVTWQPGE